MVTEHFLQDLHGFLLHLYDPAYVPSEVLRLATGCQAVYVTDCIRATIIRAIESLRPLQEVPANARMQRFYQILYQRFVLGRTQKETSEILSLTQRHFRREEHEAITQLAHLLIDLETISFPAGPPVKIEGSSPASDQHLSALAQDWRLQLLQELTSLQKSDQGHVTDIMDAVHNTTELCRAMSKLLGIDMVVESLESGLVTAIFSSVLRQALIMTLLIMFERIAGGKIVIGAKRVGDFVTVNLGGSPVTLGGTPNLEPIGTLLATQGGTVETFSDGQQLTVRIVLSAVREIKVLVVDDNEDIIYLYQRYVSGTTYHVDHSTAASWLESVESHMPDIIVLDIMMPDVDGWEVLIQLHEHSLTRAVPVIVCSIIKGEMLAISLGAALYIPKPVTQDQFLAALNRVAMLIES